MRFEPIASLFLFFSTNCFKSLILKEIVQIATISWQFPKVFIQYDLIFFMCIVKSDKLNYFLPIGYVSRDLQPDLHDVKNGIMPSEPPT